MNLLGAALYDPGTAVSKATTALLAMTAMDTTNLRVAFTVPPSGKVKVVIMGGVLHGAATYPVILLGILNSTTVVARVAPNVTVCGAASATTPASLYADFVVTGLTPGAALNWDLAYGVEQLVASTGLKYGGPNNNTTAGDAFGAISFQVWDAQPITAGAQLAVDTSGRVDVSKVAGTAQTARDLGAQLDAAVSTRLATAGYTAPDNAGISTLGTRLTAGRATNLDNLDAAVSTRLAAASYSAPPTSAANASAVRTELATELARIDVATSTRLSAAGYTAPDNAGIAAIAGYVDTEVGAIKGVTDKLDTAMELDGAVYRFTANALETAPTGAGGGGAGLDAAGVRAAIGLASANLDTQLAGISSKTANLPPDPADASDIAAAFGTVNSNVTAVGTLVSAVKLKTDLLTFNAGNVLASLEAIRGNALTGTGAGPYGTA